MVVVFISASNLQGAPAHRRYKGRRRLRLRRGRGGFGGRCLYWGKGEQSTSTLWTRYADDGDNTGAPLKLDTGGGHTHPDQVFRGSLDLEPQTIKYLIYIRHNIILYEQAYQQKYINVGCKCRV